MPLSFKRQWLVAKKLQNDGVRETGKERQRVLIPRVVNYLLYGQMGFKRSKYNCVAVKNVKKTEKQNPKLLALNNLKWTTNLRLSVCLPLAKKIGWRFQVVIICYALN